LAAGCLKAGIASEVETVEALGPFVAEADHALAEMLPEVSWAPCDHRFIDAFRIRRPHGLGDLVGHYAEDCAEGW
jgi:hypothetical protein